MTKNICCAVFLLLLSSAAFSQVAKPQFDLKGVKLGLSLEQFKQDHYSFRRGDPKHHIPDGIGPHCVEHTNDALLMLSTEEAAAGVIACYGGDDIIKEIVVKTKPAPTLANIPLRTYSFFFFSGRLFKVVAAFDSENYSHLQAAFSEKFGKPDAEKSGDQTIWSNGNETIGITHLVSNGWGIMEFVDMVIQKQINEKRPKDL